MLWKLPEQDDRCPVCDGAVMIIDELTGLGVDDPRWWQARCISEKIITEDGDVCTWTAPVAVFRLPPATSVRVTCPVCPSAGPQTNQLAQPPQRPLPQRQRTGHRSH